MPTSTRIKTWQARGKSWSAASTAFWTPCKSNIRCPFFSRAMKQPPPSKQSHGLADQQCTLIQYASFCEHHVGAFVGNETDFCRMCMLFCVAEYVCVIVEEGFVCVFLDAEFFFCFKLLNVICSLHYHSPPTCLLFIFICSFWSRV